MYISLRDVLRQGGFAPLDPPERSRGCSRWSRGLWRSPTPYGLMDPVEGVAQPDARFLLDGLRPPTGSRTGMHSAPLLTGSTGPNCLYNMQKLLGPVGAVGKGKAGGLSPVERPEGAFHQGGPFPRACGKPKGLSIRPGKPTGRTWGLSSFLVAPSASERGRTWGEGTTGRIGGR